MAETQNYFSILNFICLKKDVCCHKGSTDIEDCDRLK